MPSPTPPRGPARKDSTRKPHRTRQPPRIGVLIVDDQRTFADALAIAMGLERDFAVLTASSGEEAVEIVAREHPEVVLMDVEMPGMSGIEAITQIRRIDPKIKVLVLSAHDEMLFKAEALEAGALAYVSKLQSLPELMKVVRRTNDGELLMDLDEAHHLLRELRLHRRHDSEERERADRLTPRQATILQLIADGLTTGEISERLAMSPLTMRTHVQNILTRLAVHTKLEAVAVAVRQGRVSIGTEGPSRTSRTSETGGRAG